MHLSSLKKNPEYYKAQTLTRWHSWTDWLCYQVVRNDLDDFMMLCYGENQPKFLLIDNYQCKPVKACMNHRFTKNKTICVETSMTILTSSSQ